MKINSSTIAMAGSSNYSRVSYHRSKSVLLGRADTEKKEAQETGKKNQALSDKSKELLRQLKREDQEKKTGTAQVNGPAMNTREVSDDELQLQTLKKILEMLNKMREGKYQTLDFELEKLRNLYPAQNGQTENDKQVISTASPSAIASQNGTLFVRQTVTSSFLYEAETAAFSAAGTAKTEDGREISFQVQFEMSRSFMQETKTIKEDTQMVFCDPLVINVGSNVASVTDQKFYFDLDADGSEEEVSFAGAGSGFLALDKNGDGKINDGNELFGTQSGDGFKDLSTYDSDHNGWIDENDDVFHKLKIWTKDADGNDRLISLKDADVGAIHLGNVNTQYHLNQSMTNATNGVIRSTGIYLKESTGAAGTIQHLDLTI